MFGLNISVDEEKKPSKEDAIRKFIKIDRRTALSNLTSEELDTIEALKRDEIDNQDIFKNLPEDSYLKQSWYHFRADRLNLISQVEALKEVDNSTNGMFALIQQSVSSAGQSVANALGASNGNTQHQAKAEFEGNPADLSAAIDEWIADWKYMSDDFSMHLLKKAVAKSAKPAILVLMDKGFIHPELEQTIEFRAPGKRYGPGEYDKQMSRPVDVILKSESSSVMDAIVEHPLGSSFMSKAKPESFYIAFDRLFDTYKTDTLIGLMDKGLDPNVKEPNTGRPIICNIAYKANEKDRPVLDAMIKHGLNVRVADEMNVTPLMQGVKQGLINFVQFLLEQPSIDLYAVSNFGDTVLTLVAEGPNRFEDRYHEYELRKQTSKEYFDEKLAEWEKKAAAAKAAGEKEPDKPSYQAPREPVKEYPMELIGLIQDAWNAGDPSNSKSVAKAVEKSDAEKGVDKFLAENEDFDFGINF